MLILNKKTLNFSKENKLDIELKENEILDMIPFSFRIGKHKFNIRLFTVWEHSIFSNLFLSWLINLKEVFGNEHIIYNLDKLELNKQLLMSKINDMKFKYLVYELFKICCYPELFRYEYDKEYETEIDKELKDNKLINLMKILKRKFIINFKYFVKKLNNNEIMNLFMVLFLVNIIGFKKKISRNLNTMEKWIQMPQPDISECLNGYREISNKTRSLVMIDSEGHVVPFPD